MAAYSVTENAEEAMDPSIYGLHEDSDNSVTTDKKYLKEGKYNEVVDVDMDTWDEIKRPDVEHKFYWWFVYIGMPVLAVVIIIALYVVFDILNRWKSLKG